MKSQYPKGRAPVRAQRQEAVSHEHPCFCLNCPNMVPDTIPGMWSPWYCKECQERIDNLEVEETNRWIARKNAEDEARRAAREQSSHVKVAKAARRVPPPTLPR